MTFIPIENLGGSAKPKPQNLVIYDNGQEFLPFISKAVSANGWQFATPLTAPTITRNTSSIRLALPTNPSAYRSGTVFVNQLVDFSQYSKLKISLTKPNTDNVVIFFATSQNSYFTFVKDINLQTISGSQTLEYDVSDINDVCYIAFGLLIYNYQTAEINISNLELVP